MPTVQRNRSGWRMERQRVCARGGEAGRADRLLDGARRDGVLEARTAVTAARATELVQQRLNRGGSASCAPFRHVNWHEPIACAGGQYHLTISSLLMMTAQC